MPLFLRSWPVLLALLLPACAAPGASSSSADPCAPAAALLHRQMAGSGVAPGEAAPAGEEPRPPEMIAALRRANLRLLISQEAAALLFECRSAQAQAVRQEQAAGRIWAVTAAIRVARIRATLHDEIEAALAVSDRLAAADAALAAARGEAPAPSSPGEAQRATELRRLLATNAARRESFGAMVMLAGRVADSEMDHPEAAR